MWMCQKAYVSGCCSQGCHVYDTRGGCQEEAFVLIEVMWGPWKRVLQEPESQTAQVIFPDSMLQGLHSAGGPPKRR